ncbi:unnamed protein product [Cylicocyclus nassatus]|uniref:cGMP-dependent protein kinase interacting domain-containing protein n=1 Tax=Cylicocyclus nassatus TaxID=53992 RepID=A0AA36HA73_CYLNA|nr:unnamed protein product [Cylicocyclus nassatus]
MACVAYGMEQSVCDGKKGGLQRRPRHILVPRNRVKIRARVITSNRDYPIDAKARVAAERPRTTKRAQSTAGRDAEVKCRTGAQVSRGARSSRPLPAVSPLRNRAPLVHSMVVRDDDDLELEEATNHASILQNKQLITNNVINKRKEQLKRWESSEMNGEPVHRRKKARVQFQDSDIFLSACMSGDEEEVEELLAKGADINTATVDGLTALHQSVIDNNEGWTPLHAAACCGNLAIVRYLCQNGALLNVINSDKELALDLADDESCREYLEHDYRKQGVIPEQCRDQEFATMMRDVQQWIRDGEYRDQPHPRTGATALHVAAAKGYTQLLELLIKAGGNILARDKDGWTPLHAAAHWAEKDSCKILLEHGASVNDTNYAGQNVLAVADKDVVEYLEDLERSVDKRKSPPAAPAGILQEKNNRLSHEDHVLTTDRKHEIQRKDQVSENEVLHSSVKVRRVGDSKSPSPPSESPSLRESTESEPRSPNEAADEKLSSAERSASEPPSLPRTTRELSPPERLPSSVRSTVSADRTLPPIKPLELQRSSSQTPSTTESSKTSDGSSSSIHSGDQHVSATVPIPTRPLQQPNSWINRGVQLITRSGSSSSSGASRSSATASSDSPSPMSMTLPVSSGTSGGQYTTTAPVLAKPPCLPTTVQRTKPTPSNLPWASLSRVYNSTVQSPSSSDPQSPSVGTPTSPFAQSRVSAFRPLSSSSETAPPVVCGELPRGLHPHQLNPSKMRPWQSSAVTESEAERRNTARIQRQHRRSTQGVTKEHLEEASRIAMAEAARRRGSAVSQSATSNTSAVPNTREPVLARLASEERDSTSICSDRSSGSTDRSSTESSTTNRLGSKDSTEMDRSNDRAATTASAAATTLSLSTATTANPPVVGIRRKSQGLSVSRSNRRGTGPVLAEDIQAAVSARQPAETGGSATTARTPSTDSTVPATTTVRPTVSVSSFTRPLISSTSVRSDVARGVETTTSPNPPGHATTAPSTRTTTATVTVGRVQPRLPGQTVTNSSSFSTPTYTINARPAEMNLNYKALYEKEKLENERLRKELEEAKRSHDHNGSVAALRSSTSRFRNGSPAGGPAPVVKSASGNSLDDNDRRTMERKIADLEIQLKAMSQLRMENQRLKEENGALVRVISKMTI